MSESSSIHDVNATGNQTLPEQVNNDPNASGNNPLVHINEDEIPGETQTERQQMNDAMEALRKELAEQRQRHQELSATLASENAKLTNENSSLRMQVQSVNSNAGRVRHVGPLEGVQARLDMDGIFMTPPGIPTSQPMSGNPGPSQSVPVNTNEMLFSAPTGPPTDRVDTSQDSRIQAVVQRTMEGYLKSLDERFAKIPGVPPPIEKEAADGYEESPFVEEIARVEVPKKFNLPSMVGYDGTTDPNDHIALYKQKLMAISVSHETREAVMCKSFGTSLTGPALTWFMLLPHGSILSFADLVNAFKIQFTT